MALLILSAALAGGPVGQAAAQTAETQCQNGSLAVVSSSLMAGNLIGAVSSAGTYAGCEFFGSDVNTSQTDAEQLQLDIYQGVQNQHANEEIILNSYRNYLDLAQNRARIVGQNAYIRALNNGSSESAALTAAQSAISDYYAKQQIELANAWNTSLQEYDYLSNLPANESALSDNYIDVEYEGESGTSSGVVLQTDQMGLVNGTTHPVLSHQGIHTPAGVSDSSGLMYIHVNGPNSNYNATTAFRQSEWIAVNDRIESQHQQALNEIETVVNQTYEAYQAGEITNEDLIDPYMAAQEYSPNGSYQTWAMMELQSIGVSGPKDLSTVGNMTVTHNGTTYNGILMSSANPDSGEFAVGQTYDPANISGQQYVVTSEGMTELAVNSFTLENVTNAEGESRQNVTVNRVTYETSNINTTRMRQMYQDIREMRAEIEAREQNMNGGISFGGLFGGGSIPPVAALIAVALVALLGILN